MVEQAPGLPFLPLKKKQKSQFLQLNGLTSKEVLSFTSLKSASRNGEQGCFSVEKLKALLLLKVYNGSLAPIKCQVHYVSMS